MKNQKGYVIQFVLVVFAILIGMMIFPLKFPQLSSKDEKGDNGYCRDIIPDSSRIITVPSTGVKYKLIKERVPVSDYYENDGNYNHYGTTENYQDLETGKKYGIRDLSTGSGRSYQFASDLNPSHPYDIAFKDYGIILLFPTDDAYEPFRTGLTVSTYNQTAPLLIADIYKQVDAPPLPDWVLKCQDYPTDPATEQTLIQAQNKSLVEKIAPTSVMVPEQNVSLKKDQLQLEWFLFEKSTFLIHNWWTPHCKPAVYLYPPNKQLVNVKVYPKGELSYTDPPYDKEIGWTVNAFPDGRLEIQNSKLKIQNYDYLYYESRIRDEEIKKPAKGWVVQFHELESLYNLVLPKLGLNQKEAKDFSDYWLKTLPDSPYYFVGLIKKDQRDYLETLEVMPPPDTSIRFSLYFEPLNQPKVVEEPEITTPVRRGFTLVDWGGMIKLHPGTPFTCSQ